MLVTALPIEDVAWGRALYTTTATKTDAAAGNLGSSSVGWAVMMELELSSDGRKVWLPEG